MKMSLFAFSLITLVFAKTVFAEIPTNGLVAYFPFSGNTLDASGNGRHASAHGAVLAFDRFGEPNASYEVGSTGGVPNTADITTTSNLGISGNADRSVSIWFSLDNTPTHPYGNLISWGSDGTQVGSVFSIVYEPWQPSFGANNYRFSLNASYLKHGWLYNGQLTLGQWHHLVVTYTANLGSARMYVDGVELVGIADNTWGTNNSTLNTADSPFRINTYAGEGYGIQGKIDDVRVYNRVLSPVEAVTIYYEEKTSGYETKIASLDKQLQDADNLIVNLQGQLNSSNAQLAAISNSLAGLSRVLAKPCKEPSFTIPGLTVANQIETLISAIIKLDKQSKNEITENLFGGKKEQNGSNRKPIIKGIY